MRAAGNAKAMAVAPTHTPPRGLTDSETASNLASEKIRLLIKKQITLSKRDRSWFGLSVQERSFLNLVLSLRVKFRSSSLLRAVQSAMSKLRSISGPIQAILRRGERLARLYAEAATSWGNAEARTWLNDANYVAFLGRFLSRHGPA